MTMAIEATREICGICGRAKEDVSKLVLGLHGAACSDCVARVSELFSEQAEGDVKVFAPAPGEPTPSLCSLCGMGSSDGGRRLASGQYGAICDDCNLLCSDIMTADEDAIHHRDEAPVEVQESSVTNQAEYRPPAESCGMCGKTKEQVTKLITGLSTAVCDDCVELCNDILGLSSSPKSDPSGLRAKVCWGNQMLPKSGLVTMHSGNVSGLDYEKGIVYIKPSGFDYDAMTPSNMVPVSLETGELLDTTMRPSVDLPHHLFIYRSMPDVRAVVHTHSNYATAFAAAGKAIPLALTAIADEFGAEIPCAPYIDNEGDHIGEAILKHKGRGPAILMGNHGVFAWGDSVESALKAAVMVEDVAKTILLAMQLGEVKAIPAEEAEKWFDRYQNRYGQK